MRTMLLRAISIAEDRGEPLAVLSIDDDADCLGHARRIAHQNVRVNPLSASVD
jgi:hypothetical protein